MKNKQINSAFYVFKMTNKRQKDTIVIGLGNPLLSDEGIGVHLIRKLV